MNNPPYIHKGTTINRVQETHYYPFGMLERRGNPAQAGRISPLSNQPINLGTERNNAFLYNGKEFNDDFGLNWYDYGARFYDAQIARFHTVDPLAEVYSFQSPFAYAANNPIYYVDYMGLGPKEWWESIRGWFRDKILNRTPSTGQQRVTPEREERTVVYAKNNYMSPPNDPWKKLDLHAFLQGDTIGGEAYSYSSSFDESYRSNIRGQGVQFSSPLAAGRQVWQNRSVTGRRRTLLNVNEITRRRVFEPIRRFLELNMGNRMHIAFQGNQPTIHVNELSLHEVDLLIRHRRLVWVTNRQYYQLVLRLHGTRAYFEELERAGIIEPMNANP